MVRLLFPLLLSFLTLLSCHQSEPEMAQGDYSPYTAIPEAEFIGAAECRKCHEQDFQDWLLSDHHQAMLPANDETVLGNFDDVTFEHFGRETRFYRKGEEFWVNAEDQNGERVNWRVEYTFGYYPLQQYLIPFPGGRYQALQVCWDSRPEEEGGQRWYHLYPDEEIPPDDILHWSRRHFNWNYMCADCHSTHLRKNFDPETDVYHTDWKEINVSCEACHGPGSVHADWARSAAGEPVADLARVRQYMESKGLVVRLKEPEPGGWMIDPETEQPVRTKELASDVQLDTCARCHSHRQLLEPVFAHGSSFHDTHSPSVLTDQLYHHDGQIDEEVYVYGSWVQSRMYHSGVRCTDCHHHHTMKLHATGNALCAMCHQPNKYDTPAHHFHPVGSTGAQCVECHMPEQNYMVVDPRRDHSMRVPRPDLAKKLGSPDACTQCHEDKDIDWAVEFFHAWWGKGPRNAHYGEILASARAGEPGSLDSLIALAADRDRPGIVRATAVLELGYQGDATEVFEAIRRGLEDPDPAVREQAVLGLLPYPPAQRAVWVGPLLADPARAVRSSAARVVAGALPHLDETLMEDFQRAREEFFVRQEAVSDRAAGHMGRALFFSDLGETDKAIAAYRDAARIEPEFIPSRINLAELLYQLNRPREAESEFRAAVEAAAMAENEGQARDALARFLIRLKRYDEGIAELKRATELLPRHAETLYFYAVALHSTGRTGEALSYLDRVVQLAPRNVSYLVGAATISRDGGQQELAYRYARKALAQRPEDPQLQQLVQSLR